MADCLISLGSNLGDSKLIVESAIERLQVTAGIEQLLASELLITKPIGGPAGQPDFVNGVARFQTKLSPSALLATLLSTEEELGRIRRIRWDARMIDLDILLYGDLVSSDQSYQIPHPRMCYRRFVLEPAMEIAGEMIHPVTGTSLKELLDNLNQRENKILIVTDSVAIQKKWIPDEQSGKAGFTVHISDVASAADHLDGRTTLPKLLVLLSFFNPTDNTTGDTASFRAKIKTLIERHQGPILFCSTDPGNTKSWQALGIELDAAIAAME
ncbi:2-amino-4-hydroxy-6-hydroxymethyldihydropteridine diphosphokinase [Pirellulaceae bacterium]|jgi:2-amino-4-hydroxy-6-hydroxymethyldihydropteridine diphosphokinase|nr:2-amino-4-hydroxy-6-hydroxymethyldihydropteridine diphosphokinase [Pirellulaceae bacterium]MDB4794445.1 2-amino-4-hydroxy-6-hydroxymethyldihydropteridine diphosphokinase [Pirellulaceae bacterium]